MFRKVETNSICTETFTRLRKNRKIHKSIYIYDIFDIEYKFKQVKFTSFSKRKITDDNISKYQHDNLFVQIINE